MRVLFYEEPLTDYQTFKWNYAHLEYNIRLYTSLIESGATCRFFCDDKFSEWAQTSGVKPSDLSMVREEEWLGLLENPQEAVLTLFQRFLTPEANPESSYSRLAENISQKIGRLVFDKLDGYEPDIIISWAPAPFLAKMFPNALVLRRETALFTRTPWPLSYFLDPCGLQHLSWPALHDLPVCAESTLFNFEKIRAYFDELFEFVLPPIKRAKIHSLLSRFDKTVLVCGQANGHFSFDATCNYRSQGHMLLDVLENCAITTGVLYSPHPNDPKPMRRADIEWFQTRFPNFNYIPDCLGVELSSQELIPFVDIVATVSSSIGWQALFWGKSLIALGKSQLNRFAHAEDACQLEEIDIRSGIDTNTVAWLCFHYSITTFFLESKGWITNYLNMKITDFRQNAIVSYFDEPYDDPLIIADSIISCVQNSMLERGGHFVSANAEQFDINFADNLSFVSGWNHYESSPRGGYRWMTGHVAKLALFLVSDTDYEITVDLGTHSNCQNQRVIFELEGKIQAASHVSNQQSTVMSFVLPRETTHFPVTTLTIRADELEKAESSEFKLSLIFARISVRKLAVSGATDPVRCV
jgi:hypothetical protein